jgi:hypothetical protein
MEVGGYTLSYTRPNTVGYTDKNGDSATAAIDEPPISVLGFKMHTDYSLTIDIQIADATVVAKVNGVTLVTDTALTSTSLNTYLGALHSAEYLKIYSPQLTANQKSMLY